MEQQAFSKNALYFAFFVSLILLLVIFIRIIFNNGSKITFCGQKNNMTFILTNVENKNIVVSSSNAKDVLDCIGKSIPFYSRKIDSIKLKNTSAEEEVILRYRVLDKNLKNTEKISISEAYKNVYLVSTEEFSYLIIMKEKISPFELKKFNYVNKVIALKQEESYEKVLQNIFSEDTEFKFLKRWENFRERI